MVLDSITLYAALNQSCIKRCTFLFNYYSHQYKSQTAIHLQYNQKKVNLRMFIYRPMD